jgi:hypothetical protein
MFRLFVITFAVVVMTAPSAAFTLLNLSLSSRIGYQQLQLQIDHSPSTSSTSSTSMTQLQMAGFGAANSSSGGKKKKKKKSSSSSSSNPPPLSLKPKQQWDRYANLKAAKAFKAGVRVISSSSSSSSSSSNEWLETGKVKSENNESTEIAVVMQRGIIAEVGVFVLFVDNIHIK